MSTVGELVQQAYRENNLIAVGKDPTDAEMTEGLSVLNRFAVKLFGHELGEKLQNWPVPQPQRTSSVASRYPQAPMAEDLPSSVYLNPPPNSRIIGDIAASTTIYFPPKPSDGARMSYVEIAKTGTLTLDGNGFLIDGSATVTDPDNGTAWFFRADLGDWQSRSALEEEDDSPLPSAFDDLFITGTNIRLCPRHGKQPEPATIAAYKAQLSTAAARYHQDTPGIGGAGEMQNAAQSYADTFNPFA